MRTVFDELKDLIDYIQVVYSEVTDEWFREAAARISLWNMCDAENNFSSHKKYKQEYTTWEKESKEGGFTDD